MQFREQRLDNGLQVIAECNDQAYSTGLAFFVNAGSRDENDVNAGVSHFLEHMVFKGTATRSAADVNRQLDEIGSQSNAHTTEEQTVYHAVVLPEYQDVAVELLADIMRPALRDDDFETEKQVIVEEILKYDDQPPYGAFEKCMEAFFNGHPLGRSVLGTARSVTDLTPAAMHDYFRSRYSPANITLVAAGRVDFEGLVAAAQRHCGLWEPYDAVRRVVPATPRTGLWAIHKPIAVQQYAVQIARGPAADDDDRYANRLLATILGDDSGSRLYWELVETGMAEYAGTTPYEFLGDGITLTYVCCAPELLGENLARIKQLQHQAQHSGISNDELELAKTKTCSRIVLAAERPANRMFSVGNAWLQRRRYRSVGEVIDAYQSVTLDHARAVLERYPLTDNYTIAVGPLPQDEAIAGADIEQ